jgi:hypothetical protein
VICNMTQQNQPERKRRGIDTPWDGPAPKRKPKTQEQPQQVPQLALFEQAAS